MSLNLDHDLNPPQRRAARHDGGALLVLAGPGSGKTRTLTYRVAHLIAERGERPESILVVTFTNKAAEELRTRLDALLDGGLEGLWVHTFHACCLRLLRANAPAAGLDPHFVVFDEPAQNEILAAACAQAGWGQHPSPRELRALRDFIGQRKARLLDPTYDAGEDPAQTPYLQVAEAYQEALRRYGALDFDDLIVHAVHLLQRDEDALQQVRRTFRHVLVDEGHDMNPAQYRLLQWMAPPGSDVTLVADDNQSIYAFRGARRDLIYRFIDDYKPARINLEQTYRFTGHILAASQELISRARIAFHREMRTERPAGDLVEHHLFPNLATEQAWLVETIQRLVQLGVYRYDDIAILYRTHDLGDPVEQTLRRAGIPLQRIQRDSFFQRPGVQETLRYLNLIRSFTDPNLRAALNFPRVIADELTMLQLHSLAVRANVSLAELARNLDAYPEVSPLTRAAVRRFLRILDEYLLPIADRPAATIVNRLFDVLEARRSPFREEERPSLTGFAAFLSMQPEVAALRVALDTNRPIHLRAAPDLDALCAAVILEHTLAHYLSATVTLTVVGGETTPPMDDAWVIVLQDLTGLKDLSGLNGDLTLTPRDVGSIRYSLSTIAWRLAQGLLVSYETLDDGRFVVYDLETTGTNIRRDDIVEIGAITVDRRQEVGAPFHSLVRPRSGHIPRGATEVHGLTYADVRDAPFIEAVLPAFLRYVGDAILVGHNIERFDNPILDRELRHAFKRGLTNPSLDTLEIARRLLPRMSHKLGALVKYFGLAAQADHRALSDARHERDLLFALLAENRWLKQIESLPEVLPLVAAGLRAAGVPVADENRSLLHAAARVSRWRVATPWVDRLMELAPASAWHDFNRHLAHIRALAPPEGADDQAWAALRRGWEEQLDAFAAIAPSTSLEAFLDYAALATGEDNVAPAGEVTLMTLHNSKGKEFTVVFILGVEEGHLPDWRSKDDDAQVEEERRVLYVGMTRACDRLFLTSVRDRGERGFLSPSRFLSDVPRDNCVRYDHR